MNPGGCGYSGRQRGPEPGGGFGIGLGRGVEADPGDLDERVAGVRVDGDPLAEPRLPQLSNSLESNGVLSRPAAWSTKETEPEQS